MATSVGIKMQMDGAAQFKADLQQITQRSKELASEMKAAASGNEDLATKQKILSAQMENASAKIDKLNQKYSQQEKTLNETIKELEEAKKTYGEDSQEAQNLTLAVTKQKTALSKTKTEINKATDELNKLGNESNETAQDLNKMDSFSKKAGDGFTTLKGIAANLASQGIRKLGQELKGLVTDGAEYADEILTLSKTTSLSTDTLQKFQYMSGLVDVEVSTVAGSLKRLTKNMASAEKGSGSAYDTFGKLGVSFTDVNGNLRDNEDVFYDVIEALGKVENETERDALAMNLFGKSATDLNPMIEAGADALKEWGKEAEEAGYVMDEEMLQGLGELQDSFDRFKNRITAIKNEVASGLAPAVNEGTKQLERMISSIDWKKFGQEIGDAFRGLIDALGWVIQHWQTVATGLGAIIAAMAVSKINSAVTGFKNLATTLKSLWATMAANPVTALVGAIAAAGAALIIWQKSLFDSAKAADLNWQRTTALTTALDEAGVAAQTAADNYASMSQSLEEGASAGQIQGDHLRELKAELDGLADANGKVKKSDQARAQVILDELNGALGTEYSMTGNVIDQYSELEGSIDSLIAKKQAMLVLEAEESAYKEAIIGKSKAEAALIAMEQARIPIQDEMAMNEQRINEILAMGGDEMAAHASELGELALRNQELNASLEENQAEYDATAAAIDGYSYDIQQYTKNAAAAIEEDYDAISHKSYEAAVAQGEATSEASQQVIDNARAGSRVWLDQLGQMVTKATGKKTEFKDAGDGMVQAYVDGIKEGEAVPAQKVEGMNKQMMNRMDALSDQMAVSGGNAVEGFTGAVTQKEFLASAAGRNLANSFIEAFRKRMDEGSPSKEMAKSGLNAVLGFVNEVNDDRRMVEQAGLTLAGAFTGAFDESLGMVNVADGISGAMGGLSTTFTAAGTLSAVAGNGIYITNYIDGAENPEDYASRLCRQIKLEMRMA